MNGHKVLGVARAWFSGLFHTTEGLSEADVEKADRIFVSEGVSAMAMITLQGGVFLIGFALALGATNYEIGLLTTIALLAQFAQLGGLALIKTFRKRRGIMVLSAGISRFLWVLIILTPLLFRGRGFTAVLMWLIALSAIGAMGVPSWNSLFRDLVPDERRGRCLSRRLAWGTGLALVLTLAGGWFVDWWQIQFPAEGAIVAYSIIFALGLAFGIHGLVLLARLPEPQLHDTSGESIFASLLKPLRDKNFRHLLWFIGIWSFGVNMAAPFFIVYMLKRLGLPLFWVTTLTVLSQLSNILFLNIWVRLSNRFSNKSVLGVSGFLFLLAILGWTFTTMPDRYSLTVPFLIAIHVLSGMSVAGVSISSSNIALKLSPKGQAHAFMTVFGLAASVTGAFAPLIGGTLGDVFELRQLSIPILWSSPEAEMAIQAISLQGLDFVFLLAFILGLYSLQRLRSVTEEGEASEREVMDELIQEMATPLRSLSTVAGVRRLMYLPLAAVGKTVARVRQRANGEEPPDPTEE